jgi:hypothetical protein
METESWSTMITSYVSVIQDDIMANAAYRFRKLAQTMCPLPAIDEGRKSPLTRTTSVPVVEVTCRGKGEVSILEAVQRIPRLTIARFLETMLFVVVGCIHVDNVASALQGQGSIYN